MKLLSRQEIFTKVNDHLLTQNARSVSRTRTGGFKSCKYLSPTGLKCAVGALLDHLSPQAIKTIEGLAANQLRTHTDFELPWGEQDVELVVALQHVHDNYPPDQWEQQLQLVADYYDLEY